MGYVIQDAGLFPHNTVAQNIGLVPRLERWPADRIQTRVKELLTTVGLAPDTYAGRYPARIIGRRKAAGRHCARSLAADPPLLLLDEPFAALESGHPL